MTGKKRELSGVLTPMVTPFKDDRVLFHGLIANVEKMNETGSGGILRARDERRVQVPFRRRTVSGAADGRQIPGEGQGRDGGDGVRKHEGDHRHGPAGGR